MPILPWFHAFDRPDPRDAIKAVKVGFSVPRRQTNTKQLELALGMEAHNVYCYLGRTTQAFGEYAVALSSIPNEEEGRVSPFDTGGLVEHCSPTCEWDDDQRKNFVDDYTWPLTEIDMLFAQYPGAAAENLASYLDTDTPPVKGGPHLVWPDKTNADIWATENHWRSWTWEARTPGVVETSNTSLLAWTCPSSQYERILSYVLDEADESTADWFDTISSRYIPGGVGVLIDRMTERAHET